MKATRLLYGVGSERAHLSEGLVKQLHETLDRMREREVEALRKLRSPKLGTGSVDICLITALVAAPLWSVLRDTQPAAKFPS